VTGPEDGLFATLALEVRERFRPWCTADAMAMPTRAENAGGRAADVTRVAGAERRYGFVRREKL
jgi:hypothetical protein